MHLAGLYVYPVKALAGCAAARAAVDALGLADDRRFLIVDREGRFLTQRTVPRLARVGTALDAATLTLRSPEGESIRVPRASEARAPRLTVSVWKSTGLTAEDCGDAVADWLGTYAGVACRLVRVGPDFHRPVLKAAAAPGDRVHFGDAVPFLLLGEASLHDLNDRLVAGGAEPVPLDRFRANLVIAGSAPLAEDGWRRLRIGGIEFRSAGPCARCVVTTTDQATGERGPEPLRTLATYRRDPDDPTDVTFGLNLIHETLTGELRVGDDVEVLA